MESTLYDRQLSEKRKKLKFEIEKIEREIKDKVDQHLQRQKKVLYEQIDSLIAKIHLDDDRRQRERNHVSKTDHNSNHRMEIPVPPLLINGIESPRGESFPIRYIHPNLKMNLDFLDLGKVQLISGNGSCLVSSRAAREGGLTVPGVSLAMIPEKSQPVTRNGPVTSNGEQGDGNRSSDDEGDSEEYTNVPSKRGHHVNFTPIPAQRGRSVPEKRPPIPTQRQKFTSRTRSQSLGNGLQDNSHLLQNPYTNVNLSHGNRGTQPTRAPPVLRAKSEDASGQYHSTRRRQPEREPVKIVNGAVCLAAGK